MGVSLSAKVLSQYERFSLYNSPYVAHDQGCAIDLYPGTEADRAPSPVAGEIVATRTVDAPPKPYAADHDHLILIDCGTYLARALHVDPAVEPGEEVAVGDPLGTLVRAGFFAPWVDNHVHLGFRERGANPYRASGSLPVVPEIDIEALAWDGTGTVTETGETYAILDSPTHPDPGRFAGIAGSFVPSGVAGGPSDARQVVLDGGVPHYDAGGALPAAGSSPTDAFETERPAASEGRIEFLDTEIGAASGRDVSWSPLSIRANDQPITGLSLFCARDRDFGAKLVCPEIAFERGESVTISIHAAEHPSE